MEEAVLLKTDDSLVRILTLTAGESGDWHHHSTAPEHIVCLSGQIEVQLTGPEETSVLQPTERAMIPPERRHRVLNPLDERSSFVLVQGPGGYDFIVDDVNT